MRLFVETIIKVIDNKCKVLNIHNNTFLYIVDSWHNAVLTDNHIATQLLKRMGMRNALYNKRKVGGRLFVNLSKEEIIEINPACVIVTSPKLQKYMMTESAFCDMDFVINNHVFVVDEEVQFSPTQYCALAYFDLFQVVKNL